MAQDTPADDCREHLAAEKLVAGSSLDPRQLAELARRAPRDEQGKVDVTSAAALLLARGLDKADLEMIAANLLEHGSTVDTLAADLATVQEAAALVRGQLMSLAKAALGLTALTVQGGMVKFWAGPAAPKDADAPQTDPSSTLQARLRVQNLNDWWTAHRAAFAAAEKGASPKAKHG